MKFGINGEINCNNCQNSLINNKSVTQINRVLCNQCFCCAKMLIFCHVKSERTTLVIT